MALPGDTADSHLTSEVVGVDGPFSRLSSLSTVQSVCFSIAEAALAFALPEVEE